MKIELGDLFCYDCYNDGDYGDWYEEEIEIATEDNRYFWGAFNKGIMVYHKLKWIVKKEDLENVRYEERYKWDL